MSTGLTWVVLVDQVGTNPQLGSSIIQFSDYNEAYKFGEWYVSVSFDAVTGTTEAMCLIYTSSPNNSGYWKYAGFASFTAYDI